MTKYGMKKGFTTLKLLEYILIGWLDNFDLIYKNEISAIF